MLTQTHQNNYSLLITVKKAALSFSPTRSTKLKQAWLCVRSVVDYSLAKPFTFSAKEKDSETGLSYFCSRYYSSDLSIWLSVDPMASKYPSFSPYVYCANSPVKLVDPNGETFFEVDGETKHLDDGKNGVTIHSVNHRQYKRLENSFSHNRKRYERLCDRYKNRNGYTSVSASGNDAVNEGGTIQLSEISVNYHAGKGSTASQIANTTKTAIHKLDEGGSGDCFDRKCAEKAQPYFMAAALINPLIGVPNSIKTITTESDIYGVPTTRTDKGIAWISLGLSASALPKLELFNQLYSVSTGVWSGVQYNKRKMNKNKTLFVFIAFFVGHVIVFTMIEHYFNFKGIQMSWTEIAEDWLTFIIVGFLLATISTILWINHKK